MRHDGHTIAGAAGTIRIEGDALAGLVVSAAELVDGARVRRPRRGLTVEVAGGRARVEVELAVRYGTSVPEVGAAVQLGIAEALQRAAGLEVESVHVAVAELER
jgi:Asp23 family, cell envelope-related function